MKCIKVFNNNAVSTVMPDDKDVIVLGKGIGFGMKADDTLDEGKIEKIYYVQDEMQTKFLKLLEDIEPQIIEAAEKIIAMAEEAGFALSSQAVISLIDHINFAIRRLRDNAFVANLLLAETRILYQKEYEIGLAAIDIIRDCCDITLPEDEAGYIALHLVTISEDREYTYDTLKFIRGILSIIKEVKGIALDPSSYDVTRLTIHLKFWAQRIFKGIPWEDDLNMDDVYEELLGKSPENRECIERIGAYTADKYHYPMNRQEQFYLLVHLTKLSG